MSIPTHNLYDFVHQATKRQFWLIYFYPYGSKSLNNLVDYCVSLEQLSGENGIKQEYLLQNFRKIVQYPENSNEYFEFVKSCQPTILCHDQEPLNFEYYSDNALREQIVTHGEWYQILHDQGVKDLNLRWYRVGRYQKKWILLHSELNSDEIHKYNLSGRFECAYWWSHAMIARDWYRFAEYDQSLNFSALRKKTFLVYCRDVTGTRKYRENFLNFCSNSNLNDSIRGINFNSSSDLSAVYNVNDHVSTDITVVLETVFDQRIHLTEKTLRPIACGHPFILAAGPGSLKLLRKYGFKTFAPYINEEYDLEVDHTLRLKMIVNEMERITKLSMQEKSDLLSKCKEIAEFNKKIFFSESFFNKIKYELIENVNDAFDKVGYLLDFSLFLQMRRIVKRITNNSIDKSDYKKFLINFCRKYRQLTSL